MYTGTVYTVFIDMFVVLFRRANRRRRGGGDEGEGGGEGGGGGMRVREEAWKLSYKRAL